MSLHYPVVEPDSVETGADKADRTPERQDHRLPLQTPPPAYCHWSGCDTRTADSQTE